MFRKTLILVTLGLQLVSAQNLESILELIEKNNYSLKEKQTSINESKVNVELSNTWKNPILGFGVNDINLDDPTSRDIEAMQTQFITYSQVLPTNGKLESQTQIQQYNVNIKKIEFNNYKQKLKSQAMGYGYTIYYENEKIETINSYLENLSQQKELMQLLYENGKIDQSKVVGLDLRIYKLKLKKQKLKYKISKLKYALENIVYEKIDSIKIGTYQKESMLNIDDVLSKHPLVLIQKEKIKQQQEKTALAQKRKFSDVKFTVGYYNREKFDDYVSFNIAIPLSIQGKEQLQIKKSKVSKNTIQNSLVNLQQQIRTTIEDLEAKRDISKKNFDLIENTMIPLNDTLEESHTIHLSTNMMNSISVYESVNSKYDLILLSIDEKISYFDAISKLHYFKGNL
ncbi:TolC family protein [Arcobacteraceae bacterium]|nr:TolC family protein [Arcobacteraceae bacterium]